MRLVVVLSALLLSPMARAEAPLPPTAPATDAVAHPLPDWEGQVVKPLVIFDCGHMPKQVEFHPNGKEIWGSMLGGPPSVTVYDAQTGAETGSISLGSAGSVELLFNEDGTKVYASQMESALVYELDVATRKHLRTFDTESNWSKVMIWSANKTRMYVSNWHGNDISEFDVASGELLRKIPTIPTPRGMYIPPTGQHLYAAGFGSGQLAKIDLKTGEQTIVFSGGAALRHMVPNNDHTALYISDMGRATIWKFDLKTGETVKLGRTDSNPNTIALSPDGKILFISNRGPNGKEGYLATGHAYGSVLLMDTATGEILDSIVGGNQTTGLAISPDGTKLIFSDFRDDRIRMYEVPSYETLKAAGWPRRDKHKHDLWKRGGK